MPSDTPMKTANAKDMIYPMSEKALIPSSPTNRASTRFMQKIMMGVVNWESISGRPRFNTF